MVNIQTAVQDHRRHCDQPGWEYRDGNAFPGWARPGDVRRCDHGRIQIAYEVIGCTSASFRDLSPVFNPILWRRARAALRKEQEQ